MLLSIQYLRGIAAIYVVLYHFRIYLNDNLLIKKLGDILFDYGYFGVDLFFMISGFVIVLSTEKKSEKKDFIIKRLFRIYPVYLFILSIYVYLDWNHINNSDLLKSIFFIHLDYLKSAPFYGYSMITPAWTLSYEIIFYFLFFISYSISHKYRVIICTILIALLFTIINLYFNNDYAYSAYGSINYNGLFCGLLKILSSQMIFEFILGMILYVIYKNITINLYLMPIIGIVFLFSIVLIISPANSGHGVFNIGLGCFALLFSLIFLEKNNNIIIIKPLILLGNISYSLYLSHLLVYRLILKDNFLLFKYINQLNATLKLFSITLLCILFSYFLYILIEKPSIKLARKFLNNKHFKKISYV
ncbi:acyltransferase family protein [Proteus alimentorum]|uniref:acyltransferase family protein n=1 Tax=Proteus alimentorum TaxID=1973495 RepID=UPI000BFFED05|nr:acyltransferase [Proteus alimentorum]